SRTGLRFRACRAFAIVVTIFAPLVAVTPRRSPRPAAPLAGVAAVLASLGSTLLGDCGLHDARAGDRERRPKQARWKRRGDGRSKRSHTSFNHGNGWPVSRAARYF